MSIEDLFRARWDAWAVFNAALAAAATEADRRGCSFTDLIPRDDSASWAVGACDDAIADHIVGSVVAGVGVPMTADLADWVEFWGAPVLLQVLLIEAMERARFVAWVGSDFVVADEALWAAVLAAVYPEGVPE